MASNQDKLESIIGYHFLDSTLLDRALTHRSFSAFNNERLEFLGDAVLDLLVSELLMERFPDLDEGGLSKFRASLVNESRLSGIATQLDLGSYLRLGRGEEMTGGRKKPSLLADALEAVVLEHKPDDDRPYVLLPIHKESYLIAKHRERFEPHISLALPGIDEIMQVHNKGTIAAYARERGLPMPATWIPETVEDFHAQLDEMAVPAFVKIRESSSGVGIDKVDTRGELEKTFLQFVDQFNLAPGDLPIIQALVPGDDYCVTTLFNRGKLEACMTYRNLRIFPAQTGPGAMRETVEAPALEKIVGDVLGPLDWHGVAELDFRWDGQPDSAPHLIEVNPRFWGGLIQAVESGWDYPWLTFQLAATGKVDLDAERRTAVKTEIPILAFLATLMGHGPSVAIYLPLHAQ